MLLWEGVAPDARVGPPNLPQLATVTNREQLNGFPGPLCQGVALDARVEPGIVEWASDTRLIERTSSGNYSTKLNKY